MYALLRCNDEETGFTLLVVRTPSRSVTCWSQGGRTTAQGRSGARRGSPRAQATARQGGHDRREARLETGGAEHLVSRAKTGTWMRWCRRRRCHRAAGRSSRATARAPHRTRRRTRHGGWLIGQPAMGSMLPIGWKIQLAVKELCCAASVLSCANRFEPLPWRIG